MIQIWPNRSTIKIGIIVTLAIFLIGIPSWLIVTINAATFPKTESNILLAVIAFGHFVFLILGSGLAAFWLALLVISFSFQIQR
jgi:hypothetical protein